MNTRTPHDSIHDPGLEQLVEGASAGRGGMSGVALGCRVVRVEAAVVRVEAAVVRDAGWLEGGQARR